MANHVSAAKRNRQNIKQNERNTALRSRMRNAVKQARVAIASSEENRKELVQAAIKVIYGSASKKIIKKNTASRYVSRLSAALKKADLQSQNQ